MAKLKKKKKLPLVTFININRGKLLLTVTIALMRSAVSAAAENGNFRNGARGARSKNILESSGELNCTFNFKRFVRSRAGDVSILFSNTFTYERRESRLGPEIRGNNEVHVSAYQFQNSERETAIAGAFPYAFPISNYESPLHYVHVEKGNGEAKSHFACGEVEIRRSTMRKIRNACLR